MSNFLKIGKLTINTDKIICVYHKAIMVNTGENTMREGSELIVVMEGKSVTFQDNGEVVIYTKSEPSARVDFIADLDLIKLHDAIIELIEPAKYQPKP